MSTDEYKTYFVHYNNHYNNNQYNHYCLGPTTTPSTINFYKTNNIFYETVFEEANNKQKSDKNSLNSSIKTATTTTNQKSLTFQSTDDVNNNKNFKPMNLITNTGLDLSHSIRKPTTYNNNHHSNNHSHSNLSNSVTTSTSTITSTTTGNYYENASLNLLNGNYPNITYALSPASSSSSSSIDVENDDKEDSEPLLMSPVSIPTLHQQKPLLGDTRTTSQSAFSSAMELTAGAIPSPFSLSYQHLYANNTALYGAPVMFSGAIHAAHASYMTGLPLHAALSPNETYLKAIQAAACGIYSPTALTAAPTAPQAVVIPPHTTASSSSSSSSSSSLNCKPSPTVSSASVSASTLHNSSVTNVINLSPNTPPSPVAHTTTSPHPLFSTNIMSNCTSNANGNLKHEPTKKDYHASAVQSQTRLNATNNSHNGTYLNDKVNERLSGADAAKDSHFKVPNGKEGSLKHRILRPASNVDPATETNKTPIMRTYSSTSNFRKGNYIELANGTLRRVEDMRTEDFIQCAERSPHHQLAESTVVKINTSLPTMAVITFSYDRNRSKVDMEVSLDHPFFVYGQGWASCHPEMSLKMFGLKCQRLQVGDICISLTKREQLRQHVPPLTALAPTTVLPTHVNEVVNYQRKPAITVSSPNANTNDMPSYAHAFTMPVVQPTASHHLHQQQQAYAEMAKLMSTYAYAKALPQTPHEQLKDVVMDAPKMMNAFYQNQIFQFAQQQQQQEHLRHRASAMSLGHYNVSSHSPTQPTDLEQQPPQTQPLDVTMSRKRRWSAPENMFDDDDSETQPPRNGSSPATARL